MNVPYLSGARSEKSPFPMRVRHLEQIVHVRDDKGRIIGTKRDPVVFQNEHQYNEHLSRKGLVKMMDGEDPSLGPSQKSVYDFVDTAAPTPKAEWLASQAFFTEDLSSVGELK